MKQEDQRLYFPTRRAIFTSSLLNEPLLTLYSFLAVILYRDLSATPFHIAVLTQLKPLLACFSLYWSFKVVAKPESLRSNIILTGVLGRLPFFLFPFFDSPMPLVLAGSLFMMLSRGGLPAWMEVLKINLKTQDRSRLFSRSSAVGYAEGILLSLFFGAFLDGQAEAWRWLFPLAATAGLVGVYFQAKTPIAKGPPRPKQRTAPWRTLLKVLWERPDFRKFQGGFFLAGSGLMIIQPALPIFFVDVLQVSYTDLAIALSVAKGIGFVIASPYWSRVVNEEEIFSASSKVFLVFAAFPMLLMLCPFNIGWLYVAYFVYGIGQAGSHLIWHLSGTLFARGEDSCPYSSVNILLVGVRGGLIPPIGAALCTIMGPLSVLGCGLGLLCVSYVTSSRSQSTVLQETV